MRPVLLANEVGYPDRLQPTSVQLESGILTAVIGPNGSGKTSLLRGLARIGHPAGRVEVMGQALDAAPPSQRRSLLAFLPASREVAWPIAVRDVISLGLNSPDPGRVRQLIDMLELDMLADRAVDQLSTGERARVLLARALAPRPSLLLLDEPLSNLDPYWVLRTIEIVRSVVAEGAAALLSLHDLSLLDRFDRVLLMSKGRKMADGSPHEILRDPDFAATFRVQPDAASWRIVV